MRSWFSFDENACGEVVVLDEATTFAANKTGYMTAELMIGYLTALSSVIPADVARPVMLTLDNHATHVDHQVVLHALGLDIHLCYLPPNSTAYLQPLDALVFAGVKNAYTEHVARYGRLTRQRSWYY